MVIRPLTPELQEAAKIELGEESSRIADDLDNIREWILTQHHLQCRTDDQWLIAFLRGCKYNIEKTKTKIDNFYGMRTLTPEFFANRDPLQPEIQEFLKAGLLLPLPKTFEAAGPRIIFSHFNGIPQKKINILVLIKVYCMFFDILLLEDDNFTVAGLFGWTDCEAYPLSYYLMQLTPNVLKKFVYCLQKCYPIRIKESHCINAPLGFATVYKVLKSFLSQKVKNRIFIHGKTESKELDHILSKCYLTQQYGGTNGSMDELTEYWKNKIESYRDWFLEDEKYRSNENLRHKTSKSINITSNRLGSLNPFKRF